MARIDQFLVYAAKTEASDLHLAVGAPPLVRVHGQLIKMKHPSLTFQENSDMIFEIMNEEQRRILTDHKDIDFSYEIPGIGRFRANAFLQRKGVDIAFRIIPNRVPTLKDLGFPPTVEKLTHYPNGIILVTGPAGCGKSTTQAALIDHINKIRKEHIITIEDPIEFVHQNANCLVNQREVGRDTKSFARALKSALREDPDIILVGEMRDLETISLAITAAETGHLVIGTLHTISAAKTVDRVIDIFPGTQKTQIAIMVSESLRGIVSQQLIRTRDGAGRVAATEIMIADRAISNLIRDAKTYQIPNAMQMGREKGMVLMDEALLKLFQQNKIAYESAHEASENPDEFRKLCEMVASK
ncbi:MAG: type IV pilus twitching motility protein PilT [Deltaproteobacteria bacterium]|nr:MAG: type IV pilus twitching motility protein PilT [Deltaproteobacteria bacterium]